MIGDQIDDYTFHKERSEDTVVIDRKVILR